MNNLVLSVECMIFNKEGSVLFCGLANGEVAVLRTWDLERICSIDLPEYGSITCLKLVCGMFVSHPMNPSSHFMQLNNPHLPVSIVPFSNYRFAVLIKSHVPFLLTFI